MTPASLYQLKIWPKTHSMNKSVQQGFFLDFLEEFIKKHMWKLTGIWDIFT